MNSIELTQELSRQFAQAQAYMREQGYSGAVSFQIRATPGWKEIEFTVRNFEYGSKEIEVRGRLLGDIVEEFLRRHTFTQTQASLAIGPPTVEHNPQPEEEC